MSELESTVSTDNAAEEKRNQINKIFDELKSKCENNESIEVEILSIVKGGFKVAYKDLPLFLPFKLFSKERNVSDEEYAKEIGNKVKVSVVEFLEDDFARIAKISRVKLLEDELWKNIEVGKEILGTVKAVVPQGIVFDIGGLEGFAPVSLLSKYRVDDINDFASVGDVFKATIINAERGGERQKITLSLRNHKTPRWESAFDAFTLGSKVKGTIKSIISGGVFVELAPGIDGFVRNGEFSWTKREVDINSMFNIGQEIETEIISIDKDQEKIGLSYRKTIPNNWEEIASKYEKDSEYTGVVKSVNRSGVVVSLNDEIEGFMPSGRMRALMTGNKISLKEFDIVQVRLVDKDPEKLSMIFESTIKPDKEEKENFSGDDRDGANRRRNSGENFEIPRNIQSRSKQKDGNNYSLADLLSEEAKKILTR